MIHAALWILSAFIVIPTVIFGVLLVLAAVGEVVNWIFDVTRALVIAFLDLFEDDNAQYTDNYYQGDEEEQEFEIAFIGSAEEPGEPWLSRT